MILPPEVAAQIKLRCFEMAVAQAKVEGCPQNLDRVAEIQTWFYTRIVDESPVSSNPLPKAKVNKQSGKQAEVFT